MEKILANKQTEVVIDLAGCRDKEQALLKFGAALEFGGPNANYRSNQGKKGGWGVNWDAFNDSLGYLDSGGIWGTSRKLGFPLRLVVRGLKGFRAADPESAKILEGILSAQPPSYKDSNLELTVVLED